MPVCLRAMLISSHSPRTLQPPHSTNRMFQAKELVEGVPKVIKKEVKKEEAEKLVAKLQEVGAKVELV